MYTAACIVIGMLGAGAVCLLIAGTIRLFTKN
jgi:hypothetical protein